MFTLQQIKAAHSKVKSGADFPAYVQEMKALGVRAYEHYVSDGHIQYEGAGDFRITAAPKWPAVPIAANASTAALQEALRIHQAGGTDYPTFCRQAAEAGVDKWVVDTDAMHCTYFALNGAALLVEEIPIPAEAKQ